MDLLAHTFQPILVGCLLPNFFFVLSVDWSSHIEIRVKRREGNILFYLVDSLVLHIEVRNPLEHRRDL